MKASIPLKFTEAEQALWDEWNDNGGPSYPHEKVVQFVFRHFAPAVRAQTCFLDLGCGGGVHAAFLAREKFQVFGMDISPVAIARTHQRLVRECLNAELAIGSVDAISMPDASLHGLISIGVLDCAGAHRLWTRLRAYSDLVVGHYLCSPATPTSECSYLHTSNFMASHKRRWNRL